MAKVSKKKKKQVEQEVKEKKVKPKKVKEKKKKEEELGLLPPKFSGWKKAKHIIGGLSVLGCVVVGILAALAGLLLPAFIAASFAIGFGGIFAKELVDDYKAFEAEKGKYYSSKEKELSKSLEAEKQKEADLDKEIEKQEEFEGLEKKKDEAKQELTQLKEKTFADGGMALGEKKSKAKAELNRIKEETFNM